jgi:uncharacterized Zn-binding protein involved in type VI secretion
MLPAARIGDLQQCSNPSHGGRPILLPGCLTVRIGGKFAARTHDWGPCTGLLPPVFPDPVAVVVTGAKSVRIGGEYAARLGDETSHKGVIAQGEPTVRIGGETTRVSRFQNASDQFAIRVISGVGLSGSILDSLQELIERLRKLPKWLRGVSLDFVLLEVYDEKNKRSYIFAYFGVGLGVDFLKQTSESKGQKTTKEQGITPAFTGPWNHFTTSEPIPPEELDGFTRLTQLYVFDKSVNYFHMYGTPSGVDAVYLKGFQTGVTGGAGATTTAGYLFYLGAK